ncbi:hypothetical protein AVEN_207275-1 [Araneus ventricosus]|uniref:Uncharacterized protein n=1 Tax=Araneus ventricosus TaxID=182803 RepID=A0A4Y2ICD9_ARAVE|nr:hypothetical protein AVEN_207275-1 [Araneus ventricosus]
MPARHQHKTVSEVKSVRIRNLRRPDLTCTWLNTRRISDEIRFRIWNLRHRFNMYLAQQDGSLMKSGFESGTFDVRFNMYLAQHRRISDEIGFQIWNLRRQDLTCACLNTRQSLMKLGFPNLEPSTSI